MNNVIPVYVCQICDKKYLTRSGLWKHIIKHNVNNESNIVISSQQLGQPIVNISKQSVNYGQPISQHLGNNSQHIGQQPVNHGQPICQQQEILNDNQQNKENNKKYICNNCGKEFNFKQSKWRHEKKCKGKKENNKDNKNDNDDFDVKIKIKMLEDEIRQLKNNNNTNNTQIINVAGNYNNNKDCNITITKTGDENLNNLTYEEIYTILNSEIEGVIKYIQCVNFNENRPENHSFCSNNLNSEFIDVFDIERNRVLKDKKKYFFDFVLNKAIINQEILYLKNKSKFDPKVRIKIEDNIKNLKLMKNTSLVNKKMKFLAKQLNLLSYNFRDIVNNTWEIFEDNKLKSIPSTTTITEIENINNKIETNNDDKIETNNDNKIEKINSNYPSGKMFKGFDFSKCKKIKKDIPEIMQAQEIKPISIIHNKVINYCSSDSDSDSENEIIV
jgi:DNA-directed RNA polymerase subunit RPC12/RpoP